MDVLARLAAAQLALGSIGASLAAQPSLAARVARLPDGVARVEYASRAGVCGNGPDVVAFRDALFARGFQSYGRWNGVKCVPGPVRVTLTVSGGQVTALRTQVGGAWPASDGATHDLGVVPPAEASAFFFTLVPRLSPGIDRDRPMLAALLADDPAVSTHLIALARDTAAVERTRRDAILWLGLIGDESGLGVLHALLEDRNERERMRSAAAFALGQASRASPSESAYLRGVYARLEGDALKEAVIQAAAEDESDRGNWLLARARDTHESERVRRGALFWAGQHEATPTADLVAFLRAEPARGLREHAVFVLSQRQDPAATDSLLAMARGDADAHTRSRALFWLAQKGDPRVTKLITELLEK